MIGRGRISSRLAASARDSLEKVFPLVAVAIIWESVARLHWVDPLFLPSFTGMVEALWSGLFVTGFLVTDAAHSLVRVIVGLAMGSAAGVLFGTLMGQFRPVRVFLDPLMSFVFPMPKLAIFPLIVVWLGLGESSKVAVIAISAFFPVVVNTYAGIRNVDKFLIWNALSKGANRLQLLVLVLVPATVPYIFAGLRVAASFSFLMAVSVEMLQSNNGLGYRILFAKSIYQSENMYAALMLVAILGFSVDRLVRAIGRRLLTWQETIE